MLADQLGFDELWMGEHFSATTEPFPSPLMFLAGLVPHTKNITFGTAVINLPNHHPAIIAAEAAQFDHMSKGRFMLGVGPGGLVSDFELFKTHRPCRAQPHGDRGGGHDPTHLVAGPALRSQGRVLAACASRTRSCPSSASASCRSRTSSRDPPISISLASPNSSSARTAALKGWGMISANIIPTYSVASHWDGLQQGLRRAGIAPPAARTGASRAT